MEKCSKVDYLKMENMGLTRTKKVLQIVYQIEK